MRRLLLTTSATSAVVMTFLAGCDTKVPQGPTDVRPTTSISTTTTSVVPMPKASFTVSPTSAAIGQEVHVNASGSAPLPGQALMAYNWDFGDGTVTTGMTSFHIYKAAGIYTITLTVVDDAGQRGIAINPVTVAGFLPTTTTTIPVTKLQVQFGAIQALSADVPGDMTLTFALRAGLGTGTSSYDVTGTYKTSGGRSGTVDGELLGTLSPTSATGDFRGALIAEESNCTAQRSFSGTIGTVLQWTGRSATGTCKPNPLTSFDSFSLLQTGAP